MTNSLTEQFKALLNAGLSQADVLGALGEATPKHPAIEVAKREYANDDISFDDLPLISEADIDEGCHVLAWVWVNAAEYTPCTQHRNDGRDVCADCGTAL